MDKISLNIQRNTLISFLYRLSKDFVPSADIVTALMESNPFDSSQYTNQKRAAWARDIAQQIMTLNPEFRKQEREFNGCVDYPRELLFNLLQREGLRVDTVRTTRWTLTNSKNQVLELKHYVNNISPAEQDAAMFGITGKARDRFPWFAFCVTDWGKVYLKRRDEVVQNNSTQFAIYRHPARHELQHRYVEMAADYESWAA
jgi:hypothetical protein